MKQTSPAQKGIITGVLMILALLLSFYVLKNPVDSYFQLIVYGLFTAGIAWSLFDHLKVPNGAKRFKDFFSVGFKTFVIVVLLMALYTFVFFTFNTGFRDDKIAENSKMLVQQGNHLPNEIGENAKKLKEMFMPLMISSAVFRYLIIGAMITAIGSGFLSSRVKAGETRQ